MPTTDSDEALTKMHLQAPYRPAAARAAPKGATLDASAASKILSMIDGFHARCAVIEMRRATMDAKPDKLTRALSLIADRDRQSAKIRSIQAANDAFWSSKRTGDIASGPIAWTTR